MKNVDKTFLMIGLPETGKSSFIQALDEVLKNPQDSNSLCSDGLAQDRSYLNHGKADFVAGKQPDRTNLLNNSSVELLFEHPPTKMRGRLELPDKKGEIFLEQWITRQWEIDYRESLSKIDGALIFVRADGKSRNEERLGVLATQVGKSKKIVPWDIKQAGSQVQLVDVLQFMVDRSAVRKPLRTAVIISAWDTVGAHESDIRSREPAKFLEREWALLAQYLRANPEQFISKIYGVSAFGGEPSKQKEVSPLAGRPPHERVQVCEGTETSSDLTRPLRWLLELN